MISIKAVAGRQVGRKFDQRVRVKDADSFPLRWRRIEVPVGSKVSGTAFPAAEKFIGSHATHL